MEEVERSLPPDPAESAAAEGTEQPYPNGENVSRYIQLTSDACESNRWTGLTQEALIEVLRNQHQNIVQHQNLIAGQGARISELTKLVSGLVQMQTDVLKDQAQREADERERKAEEERVTYRTVHNLRSKIQEEGMRSTPGYPSENDLDRGCVFWMSATQRNCKRQ